MNKFILGTKAETTQQFNENGERIAVTRVLTSPCYLIDIKSPDKDGYWAVLIGFGMSKRIQKSRQGLLTKAGIKTPLRFLKEVRVQENELEQIEKAGKKGVKSGNVEIYIGDEIKPVEFFIKDEKVTVSGISKGKGFQGVVKRHGFAGGPRTHGQSDRERAPGSIGTSNTPGRVMKGKKMAGRMGGDKITIKGLKVVSSLENELHIQGLVPGSRGSLIIITA